MTKLLRAECKRLFKNKIFLFALAFSFLSAVFFVGIRWFDGYTSDWYVADYTDIIFIGCMYLVFVMAPVVALFVGCEFSEGAIRNKLVVGHRRGDIYLTELLMCCVADLLLLLINILTVLGLGRLLIGAPSMDARRIIVCILLSMLVTVVLTAIHVLISMSVARKAGGAIICLLLTVVMFFLAISIFARLSEPPTQDRYEMIKETGELVLVKDQPNPYYLDGWKRQVYGFFHDVLPISQFYQIIAGVIERPARFLAADVFILVLSVAAGWWIFKKKDLK